MFFCNCFVFRIITALNVRLQSLILGMLRIRGLQTALAQPVTMICSDQATPTKMTAGACRALTTISFFFFLGPNS